MRRVSSYSTSNMPAKGNLMTTTQQKTQLALWSPGWYELDQSVAVGNRQRFWFFQNPPADLDHAESFDFVFFNENSTSSNVQVREANVVSIEHEQLGKLSRIDAEGLDYTFTQENGKNVVVNAEEDPGTVYDAPLIILDWSVQVGLSDVSPIITDET